ncbi:MAG: diguanylate cyclase [Pseudomonadota bacterium]
MTNDEAHRKAQLYKLPGIMALLLLLSVGAIAAIYRLPTPIVNYTLEADLRQQAELWKRRVVLHMADTEASFDARALEPSDEDFLMLLPEASDVYRFKLFDADGRIFWSSRKNDIGGENDEPYFDAIVAQGQTHFKQVQKPSSEIDDLLLHVENVDHSQLREVAEVYTPVMIDGRFVGAIEFYTDVTETMYNSITRIRYLLATFFGIAITSLGIVLLVIYRANKSQMRAMQKRNAKERSMMDEQLRLAREVRLLGELNEWLQSSRSLEELFNMVARFMTHILPDAEGSIYVYSNSRDVLDGCASWNGGTHKEHIHPEECWGLRRGRTYEYGASEIDFVCEHAEPHDGRPYFSIPILAHGETVGLMHLCAVPDKSESFRESKKLAQMCAEQISMAIANVRMRDQLHDQSVRDPLTGLFNRRHMTETLRKSIAQSQKTGDPLSVIAIDVDHFKKFNDTHGHDAGDMVLRAVGSVLEQVCDGEQVACRIGGEEFTALLPGTSNSDALKRAEELRQAVEAVVVRYGDKNLPRVTISAGVSHYPAHGTMPQDLMRAADDALYVAKGKGRNQVVCAANSALIGQAAPETLPDDDNASPQIAAE